MQYNRCWAEWTRFCIWYKLDPLRATPSDLLGYLRYVAQHRSGSLATAQTHCAAIAYNYRLNGMDSITDHVLIRMYMKGVKCENVDVPVKR